MPVLRTMHALLGGRTLLTMLSYTLSLPCPHLPRRYLIIHPYLSLFPSFPLLLRNHEDEN